MFDRSPFEYKTCISMATKTSTVTQVPFGPSISTPEKAIDVSVRAYLPSRDALVIPPSHLLPQCYHREKHVTEEVNAYFLEHWPFENEKSRTKFVHAGFSTVTCWYFPKALDDRIHFACRLLTLLFLIDGSHLLSYQAGSRDGSLTKVQTCSSTCPWQKGRPIIIS
jgi:hypothetical protein